MHNTITIRDTAYTVDTKLVSVYHDDLFCIEVPHMAGKRVWHGSVEQVIHSAYLQDNMNNIPDIASNYPEQTELENCLEFLRSDLHAAYVFDNMDEVFSYIANNENCRLLVATMVQFLIDEEYILEIEI